MEQSPMAFLTPEFISLIGGSLVGFLFRHMAEKRENEKQMVENIINLNKQSDESHDKAVQRVPMDVGKNIRRIIVLAVLFATMLAPFVLPFFGIPTFLEVDQSNPDRLFGLIPAYSQKFIVEINGFVYPSENRQILLSLVGFYFGNAAGKAKT